MGLIWSSDDDTVVGLAHLRDVHEGAGGAAHGGLLAALFDEVLGRACEQWGPPSVTASLTVNYLAPIRLPTDVEVRGRCADIDGRKIRVEGEIRQHDQVAATASGLWITLPKVDLYAENGRTT
ncbi:PaaI family thioesterase [Rhodococcus sp. NPDC019627]|uniref:PaaI family thioesterase n=1 Tax=unclassified Rhodococcus (in: high G+C Gram-positive bacteria) TaxID=192944 RepID=UPI0033DDF4A5